MKYGLLTAWIAEVVLIWYRSSKNTSATDNLEALPQPIKGLPMPREFASTFVVYGALGLWPESAGSFPAVVGWGFVLATLLNLTPSQNLSNSKLAQAGPTPGGK
jgi:hypothetical protein